MGNWGISSNATPKEKIKSEMADLLHGLNSTGEISHETYSEIFDCSMGLFNKMYDVGAGTKGSHDDEQSEDDKMAEKSAIEIMGWKRHKNTSTWDCGNPSVVLSFTDWDPCNRWKDAMRLPRELTSNQQLELDKLIEEYLTYDFFANFTSRELTELCLEAAGIDVE